MNIDFKDAGPVLVARIADKRIDASAGPDLKAKVGARIEQGAQKLVLDLTDVEFVDSTGLGAILAVVKRVPASGSVVLCGCRPTLVDLMRLTRLDRVFKIYGSQDEATAALSA
jgi:anti-sigma B factor antagonist